MSKKVYLTGYLQGLGSQLGGAVCLTLYDVKEGEVPLKDIVGGKITILAEIAPKIIEPDDAEWLTGSNGLCYLMVDYKLHAIVDAGGRWIIIGEGWGWRDTGSQSIAKKQVVEYLAANRVNGYKYEV